MVSALIARVQGPQPRKGGGRMLHAYRPGRWPLGPDVAAAREVLISGPARGSRLSGADPTTGIRSAPLAVERATRAGGRGSRERDEAAGVRRGIVEL